MKNISNRLNLFFIISIILLLAFGCSNKSKNENIANDTTMTSGDETEITTEHKQLVTVKDTIQEMLSDAMERLRYWDNSGLYENEFGYYTDETSFDDYLKTGQISYRNPATVMKLVVDSLFQFNHDSAEVWATVTLKQPDGKIKDLNEQRLMVYWYDGKWIKPTVSVIKYQVQYDSLIQQAEKASEWENE